MARLQDGQFCTPGCTCAVWPPEVGCLVSRRLRLHSFSFACRAPKRLIPMFSPRACILSVQCAVGSVASTRCGLTPRSNRAPTAKRQGRATVQVCFYCSAALALCRWCRFNSNVRPQQMPATRAAAFASGRLLPASVSAVAKAGSSSAGIASLARLQDLARSGYRSAAGGGNTGSGGVLPVRVPRSRRVGRRMSRCRATGWSVLRGSQHLRGVAARSRLRCATVSASLPLRFFLCRSEPAHTSLLAESRHSVGSVRAQLGGFHQLRSNPSFKPSPNGKPPGPVCGKVHSPQPGPGALPLVPA